MNRQFSDPQARCPPKPAGHARAINSKCIRCKQLPAVQLLPCGHEVCYQHYLGKTPFREETYCAVCGKSAEGTRDLGRENPVTPTSNPLDTTWSIEQPRDLDIKWPTTAMYPNGNGNGRQQNGQNGGNGFDYYKTPQDGFPQLRNVGRDFQPGFPPPSSGVSNFDSGYGQSNFAPPSRGYGMTPGPADQFGGNMGFNPNGGAPRYVPPAMRQSRDVDPIVRPESSISNHTFATQLPQRGSHMNDIAPPRMNGSQQNTRQRYDNPYGNSMNQLGAGLSNMRFGDFEPQSRALSRVSEGSDGGNRGNANGNGGVTRHSNGSNGSQQNGSQMTHGRTPSSRFLAEEIMSGSTEDPFDRSLRRLDTPPKMAVPQMGPARYKDSKMFSGADSANADVPDNAVSGPRYQPPRPPNPDWLPLAVQGMMKPNLDEAFDSLPLTELPRALNPSGAGVIRVKDIPYVATKQEMTAFVGRQAQILRQPEGSPYHAVHILMERESGKTMDCFIEFANPNEAAWVVRQIARRVDQGRPPKVGERTVEVDFSSQDELMSELFPRAKHVRFTGGKPVVDQTPRSYYEGQPADGFQGFMHPEEFIALQKHAGLSDRSPFASKSPCRVYEVMITLLWKYPWHAVNHISIRERRAVYDCASNLIRILCENLRRSNNKYSPLEPTPALLQELVSAALACPGFSERQKNYLAMQVRNAGYASIAAGSGVNITMGGSHPLSAFWPFAALSIIPGTDDKLVEYYAKLFRDATSTGSNGEKGGGSLASRMMAKTGGQDNKPMGDIKVRYGDKPDVLTLAQVAEKEYNKIEELLSRVLVREGEQRKPSPAQSIGPDYKTSFSTGNGSRNGSGGSNGSSSAGARSLW